MKNFMAGKLGSGSFKLFYSFHKETPTFRMHYFWWDGTAMITFVLGQNL